MEICLLTSRKIHWWHSMDFNMSTQKCSNVMLDWFKLYFVWLSSCKYDITLYRLPLKSQYLKKYICVSFTICCKLIIKNICPTWLTFSKMADHGDWHLELKHIFSISNTYSKNKNDIINGFPIIKDQIFIISITLEGRTVQSIWSLDDLFYNYFDVRDIVHIGLLQNVMVKL